MTRPNPGNPDDARRWREAERQRRLQQQRDEAAAAPPGGHVERPDPNRPGRPDPNAPKPPPSSDAPAPPTEGSYPSEEPGFGDVLSRLFTPPAPTVIPTPYDGGAAAPGGSRALLGAVAVGALGYGAWYLWKRSRA